MSEPKTFRVQLDDGPNGVAEGRYIDVGQMDAVNYTWVRVSHRYPREVRELDITITVPKSREERLREARLSDLVNNHYGYVASSGVLSVIERVDAEFSKEEGDGG